jgi:peptidoglycan hydrolase CwlO-like protein
MKKLVAKVDAMPPFRKWLLTTGSSLAGIAIVAFVTWIFTSNTTAQKTKDDIVALQDCSKELQERVKDLEKNVVYKEAWIMADEKYEKKIDRLESNQDKMEEKLDKINDKIDRLK